MEVLKQNEPRWSLACDLQFDLALHRQVVDGGAAIRDVELGRGIEIEEVRTAQATSYEAEPVDRPERERADPGAGRSCIAKPHQAHGQARIHRPLSRRRAKRSGSLAFRMARCAPLMS